jgi:hypothetical protein
VLRHGYIVLYVRSICVLRMSYIKKNNKIQHAYSDRAFLAILALYSYSDWHDVIASKFGRTKKLSSSMFSYSISN